MLKRFILTIVLLIASTQSSYASKYAGFGIGPDFVFKGNMSSLFLMQGEWQPHKVLGAKFFVGFKDGIWLGPAINFNYLRVMFSKNDYLDLNISIPMLFEVRNSDRTAYIGLSAGAKLAFSVNESNTTFIYISPAELWYLPLVWQMYPNNKWQNNRVFSIFSSVGFRMSL